MKNITVTTATDEPETVEHAAQWFATWAADISYKSDDKGCGCCVDIWDVTCSDAAAAALPGELFCASEWSAPELFLKTKPSKLQNLRGFVFWRRDVKK